MLFWSVALFWAQYSANQDVLDILFVNDDVLDFLQVKMIGPFFLHLIMLTNCANQHVLDDFSKKGTVRQVLGCSFVQNEHALPNLQAMRLFECGFTSFGARDSKFPVFLRVLPLEVHIFS